MIDIATSDLDLSPGTIRTLLGSVRAHFDMDVAFVGEFIDGRRVFRYVDTAWADCPVVEGCGDPMEDSYCLRVVDGRLPPVLTNAALHPEAASLPVTAALPVGGHMSVPIRSAAGEVLGTFCCFATRPRAALRDGDAAVLRVVADVVADALVRDRAARADSAQAEARVRSVLDSGGPQIVFQPIVDLSTGEPVGYEALSRFTGFGPIEPPDVWFARARSAGLGVELELAAARAALSRLPDLPADTYLSLNLSEPTLTSAVLTDALAGQPLHRIVLELTEETALIDADRLARRLRPLQRAGARVAVDDTGSGYAGLRQVLAVSPDVLKIDRDLVQGIDRDSARQALTWALAWFGSKTGAAVVAEGVETRAELNALASLGIRYVQGYYLGRPTADPEWAEVIARARQDALVDTA